MFASQIFTNFNVLLPRSASAESSLRTYSTVSFAPPSCSFRCQEIAVGPLELHSKSIEGGESCWSERDAKSEDRDGESRKRKDKEEEVGDSNRISGIRVPRQRYIPVSKAQLLEALQSMFEPEQDVNEFLRFASCLDSILHAEHKGVLEQLRMDYSILNSAESRTGVSEIFDHLEEKMLVNGKGSVKDDASDFENSEKNEKEEDKISIPFNYNLDLSFLLGSSAKNVKRNSSEESSIAIATRFQRGFMKLLRDAQFEELSARDLLLTSALNTDYLLTLPIYVDWKKASESNAIIFRRGYGTERQNGLLIVEKLDYLQSKLLQRIFFNLSKPLRKVGMWINEALESATHNQEIHPWVKKAKQWFKESLSPQTYFDAQRRFDNQLEVDQLSKIDLPIWLAAQRAVSRYEDFLSPVGPRGRLLRKLLSWIGLVPSTPETSFELENDDPTSELYLRPTFLSRISLGDIWKPATRENCGNDVWKMLKNAVSILFSHSLLQEPAFQELILLYSEQSNQGENEDNPAVPLLKLKIYENIPIPDLPVIFPHKKLSFRILDTVRLDIASILGLLAFFVNYKFEDVLSSPSAILLDVIAISALVIYVSRVALGYKQTWDRYQLLVNRTLYEKTLASGFGSVHFLLDASEQQKYKEAILAYAVLLQADNCQMSCDKSIGSTCERFIYDKFKEKVDMPAYEAIDTLRRLGLVTEVSVDGNLRPQALSCSEAYKALKQRWNSLLS